MAEHQFVELAGGDYRVTLSNLGASLVQLRHQGQNYCPERPVSELVPRYHGSVIAPWANRIADGEYEFKGEKFSVPVNETALNNSLHGLSGDLAWGIASQDATSCSFSSEVGGIEGYPWKIKLTAKYSLAADGLELIFTATNASSTSAPFTWAFHPYFQLPQAEPAGWRLTMPAAEFVEVDERLLPIRTSQVTEPFDFTGGAPCCFAGLDHAFGSLPAGEHQAQLSAAGSKTLTLSWDEGSPWVQLHHPPAGVRAVVVEPQSSPPDAFNSKQDLVVLEPGSLFQARISIKVQ